MAEGLLIVGDQAETYGGQERVFETLLQHYPGRGRRGSSLPAAARIAVASPIAPSVFAGSAHPSSGARF